MAFGLERENYLPKQLPVPGTATEDWLGKLDLRTRYPDTRSWTNDFLDILAGIANTTVNA